MGGTDELLNTAPKRVNLGWHVFPCWPQTKKPITSHGWKAVTDDSAGPIVGLADSVQFIEQQQTVVYLCIPEQLPRFPAVWPRYEPMGCLVK